MLVSDRQTRPWLVISAVILLLGVGAYFLFQSRHNDSSPGGTIAGLVLGSISLAMMTFAMLLALRKKLRTVRMGRAYFWMQGHVWLGMLSYPFAFFHSGFRWGMPFNLTWAVMTLFFFVIVSGIVGLVIQQIIPRMILKRVKRETVYEQHEFVLGILRREVDERMTAAEKQFAPPLGGTEGPVLDVAHSDVASAVALKELKKFHCDEVLPFLQPQPPRFSPLRHEGSSAEVFRKLYVSLPGKMTEPINDIEEIVSERRQMLLHRRLHRWLHLWLFVHVPISYALFVLVILHVLFAIRFL